VPPLLAFAAAPGALAEVIEATPERYVLRQEATSALAPDALWARLLKPETWWHPDHTYSGKAENLSLDAQAGGLWREDWEGGSVFHGRVLQVQKGKMLRLDAPFGPLQDIAVTVVWTITLTEEKSTGEGTGTRVVFEETANGTPGSKLDALAPAVDFVKTGAIRRLTAPQ
jgi:uncharacterized protein YndB with AHSA1/START domain